MTNLGTVSSDPRRAALARQVRLLSWGTLVWLAFDGAIGMTAGIAANSVALIGWGLDCAIQAAAALIVLWRFTGVRAQFTTPDELARRVVGVSFFLLVPYIVVVAVNQLAAGDGARGSLVGVTLAAIDAALMPFIGRAKQRLGAQLGSAATSGAGRQNVLCAYLSVGVLIGLGANLALGWWWADPSVALLVAAACLEAGWKTWRGETCEESTTPVSGATNPRWLGRAR
jgi:divalent metal cation (Fe/Co/Zn/Cd) transporter